MLPGIANRAYAASRLYHPALLSEVNTTADGCAGDRRRPG